MAQTFAPLTLPGSQPSSATKSSEASPAARTSTTTLKAIITRVTALATEGDTIVAMSNGSFGDIHDRLLARLAVRGL